MFNDFFHAANLHLFDGGSAAGTAGGDGSGEGQAGSQAEAVSSQAANTGDNPTADAGQNPKTPEQLQEEFQKLIKGEYKEAYTKDFQVKFNARFKDTKANQERLDSYQPIIDTLSSRYGITDGDMGKLAKAIESDESLWAEAAEEAGMTVEQFRHVKQIEAENARFKAEQQQNIRQQMAQRQMEVWSSQVEEVRKSYPNFNLEDELNNPGFKAMLRAGASIRNAYESTHLDDIKRSLVASTAQQTTKEITDNIKAKGMRPTEVGGSQAGVPLSVDLKNSTKAQREEWARRAERGETITFQ